MHEHKNVCIYHANCLDGIAAAWVVWKYFDGNVKLISAQYKSKLPEGLEGKNVFVVDFSYPLPEMVELASMCHLVVLDHHDTAERVCADLRTHLDPSSEYETNVIFDMKRSGAGMAWDYFYPLVKPPLGIELVQDRDLWKFKNPLTKSWTAAAFSYPLTVESIDTLMATDPYTVKQIGDALLRKQELEVAKIAKTFHLLDIDGVTFAAVNANYCFASDLGDALKHHGYPVAVYANGRDSRYYSLRSDAYPVNVIAERFGGGGHVQAAAFTLPYNDSRFTASHKKLRSKGFYWNKVLNLFKRGRQEPEWPVIQVTSRSSSRIRKEVKS